MLTAIIDVLRGEARKLAQLSGYERMCGSRPEAGRPSIKATAASTCRLPCRIVACCFSTSALGIVTGREKSATYQKGYQNREMAEWRCLWQRYQRKEITSALVEHILHARHLPEISSPLCGSCISPVTSRVVPCRARIMWLGVLENLHIGGIGV